MKRLTPEARDRQIRLAEKQMCRIKKKNLLRRKGAKLKQNYIEIKAPDTFTISSADKRQHLLHFLSKLREAVILRKRSVRIDLRGTQKMFADGTLLFYAELCRINRLEDRVKVRCLPPRSRKIAQVLKQVGIFDLLGYWKKIETTHVDVIHWRSAKGHEVVGEKFDEVLGHYDGQITEVLSKNLYLGFTEAMTNCHHHAYIGVRQDGLNVADEPKEWWMFSQERNGLLTVVFCDLGIGIPGTLPIKQPTLWQRIQHFGSKLDAHAIQEAIGESRTRTGLHHRGKGLKQLVDVIAQVEGGQVNIFSNRGCFTLKSGSESIAQFKDNIYGTLIHWQVPIRGVAND
ncbi:MAG: hypothetical protein PHI29_13020 [Gallionella sp.]|nr:hypothetical protein [Gallionella sp.]